MEARERERNNGKRGPGRGTALFAAASLACAIGVSITLRGLPWHFEPRTDHPGWATRYERLRAHLANEPLVFFLPDADEGRGRYRMFRAQYVLAPTVFVSPPRLEVLHVEKLLQRPLVLDYGQDQSLSEDLAALAARAERAGLALESSPVAGHMAVVRAVRSR